VCAKEGGKGAEAGRARPSKPTGKRNRATTTAGRSKKDGSGSNLQMTAGDMQKTDSAKFRKKKTKKMGKKKLKTNNKE